MKCTSFVSSLRLLFSLLLLSLSFSACGTNRASVSNTSGVSLKVYSYKTALSDLEAGCQENSAIACHHAGLRYSNGEDAPKDDAKAFELTKKSCDLKHATSCNNLAVSYFKGEGTKRDLAEARKAYEQACELNYSHACSQVGLMFRDGIGGEKDKKKSYAIFQKGCSLRSGRSCRFLSDAIKKSPKHNPKVIRGLAKRGCRFKDAISCVDWGMMRLQGIGGQKTTMAVALENFKEGCELKNAVGCRNAGILLMKGEGGVTKDCQSANNYFQRGCKGGDKMSCRGKCS
jgi:TPR repeat protein